MKHNSRVLAYQMAKTLSHTELDTIAGGQADGLNFSHQFTHQPVANGSDQTAITIDETFD